VNNRIFSADGIIPPPILFRAIPFAVFVTLLAIEPWLGRQLADILDPRWLYGGRSIIVAGLLLLFWHHYRELVIRRPKTLDCLLAVGVGFVVLAFWLKLDAGIFVLGQSGSGFDPREADGSINWPLAVMRLAGSALVVPVMEELFWRSLVMRWLENTDFATVDPARVGIFALLFSSIAFGFEHSQWAAGILAGVAYGWLYLRCRNLWLAIIAHAVTNAGLGIWVLATASWYFW
jgi:CAAX prenyl protease-like protein